MRSSPEPESLSEVGAPAPSPAPWALPDLAQIGRSPAIAMGEAGPDGSWVLPDLGAPMRRECPEIALPVVDESYERGYADGLRDGAAGAERELRAGIEAIRHIADALAAARSELAADHARGIYALATAVAKKLLQREIETDPDTMRGLIERAMELMPADSPFTARLHPADLEALAPTLEAMDAQGRGAGVEWLADATLERGGFRLENPLRVVDGRIDVALRNLYESLDYEWDRHA